MRLTLNHIRRKPGATLLLLLLLILLSFFLVFSFTLRQVGKDFMASLQSKLGTNLVITTPFQITSDFRSEEQIVREAKSFESILLALQEDNRVRSLYSSEQIRSSFLTFFANTDSDQKMRGVVFLDSLSQGATSEGVFIPNGLGMNEPGRGNGLSLDEEGRFQRVLDEFPVRENAGESQALRGITDINLRRLETIRFALAHKDQGLLFQQQPEIFGEAPDRISAMTFSGVLPTLISVKDGLSSDFLMERAQIYEGRMLTEEDDQNNAPVAVFPINSYVVDQTGYRPVQVGDVVPLSIQHYGKIIQTTDVTVVGLHNGNTGIPMRCMEQIAFWPIYYNVYLPQSFFNTTLNSVEKLKNENHWQNASNLALDGSPMPSLEPLLDKVTPTAVVVEAENFTALNDLSVQLQMSLAPFSAEHDGLKYQLQTSFDEYRHLAGVISSTESVFQILSIFSGIITFLVLLFLFMMLVSRRAQEEGVLRSLGATKKQIKRHYLMEYGVLGIVAYLIGTVVAVFLSSNLRTLWTSNLLGDAVQDALAIGEDSSVAILSEQGISEAGTMAEASSSSQAVMEAAASFARQNPISLILILGILWVSIILLVTLWQAHRNGQKPLTALLREEAGE